MVGNSLESKTQSSADPCWGHICSWCDQPSTICLEKLAKYSNKYTIITQNTISRAAHLQGSSPSFWANCIKEDGLYNSVALNLVDLVNSLLYFCCSFIGKRWRNIPIPLISIFLYLSGLAFESSKFSGIAHTMLSPSTTSSSSTGAGVNNPVPRDPQYINKCINVQSISLKDYSRNVLHLYIFPFQRFRGP